MEWRWGELLGRQGWVSSWMDKRSWSGGGALPAGSCCWWRSCRGGVLGPAAVGEEGFSYSFGWVQSCWVGIVSRKKTSSSFC